MNVLIMLCGLPKSGKSTWAKEQNLPIVNPDSIRLALHGEKYIQDAEPMVWAIAKYMVKALFYAGNKVVILDATNVTEKRRKEWYGQGWEVELNIMNTPLDECIQRAMDQKDYRIIEVIKRMYKETDIPAIRGEYK